MWDFWIAQGSLPHPPRLWKSGPPKHPGNKLFLRRAGGAEHPTLRGRDQLIPARASPFPSNVHFGGFALSGGVRVVLAPAAAELTEDGSPSQL